MQLVLLALSTPRHSGRHSWNPAAVTHEAHTVALAGGVEPDGALSPPPLPKRMPGACRRTRRPTAGYTTHRVTISSADRRHRSKSARSFLSAHIRRLAPCIECQQQNTRDSHALIAMRDLTNPSDFSCSIFASGNICENSAMVSRRQSGEVRLGQNLFMNRSS